MTDTPTLSTRFDVWFSEHRLLVLALVGAFIFHGGLLLAGSYKGTYDAYVHIFFGDHYARSWWNPWEPRWYTGFTMVSYPPLTHQLTALISKVSTLPTGFITVMLVSSVTTTLGVYRFSRLWVDERPAQYAAVLAMLSSSIAETVHVFGQLPTIFVMGVMLNALPFVWRWVEDATFADLVRGWSLLMVAAAGHHVTTLFGMVFFSGPILTTVLLRKFRTPRPDETDLGERRMTVGYLWALVRRRVVRAAPAFFRCGVFGVGLIIILVTTVLPYWLWSHSDPITQITIPHASRDSFLENQPAGLVFFLIPWGVMLFVLPYAFYKGFGSGNWILACSLALLSLLGTGGTTPIPAKLLGGAFYILTLDRFTFWASIVILPFAGQFVESLLHGRLGQWISAHLGSYWRPLLAAGMAAAMVGTVLFTANLTQYRKFQPDPIDMTPIVEFLAKDNHDSWRYMTLGFGDQMAWLSAQTTAYNVEGNYHSARRLPEMTSTPVERMDGAKFTSIPGLGSLQAFVTNPQRYNLKYIFSNDNFYEPLLYFAGWHNLGQLENGVQVWERSDVPPLPASVPVQVYPAWQRLMWGVLPVGSLFVAATTFVLTGVIVPRFKLRPMQTPPISWVVNRWLFRFWLLADDSRDPQPASEDWQIWKQVQRRFFPYMRLTPVPLRALYGAGVLALFAALAGYIAFAFYQNTHTPQAAVLDYYDALDFKRFVDSYTYLDTDLTQEEYLRWLSLQGGILASFAKLENLYTDIEVVDDDTLYAYVTADWLTSLGTYTVEERWQLNRVDGRWLLELDVPPPSVPRETAITTETVNFYLNLPLSDLDETALSRGVLDRSLLSVSPVTAVYVPQVTIGFAPEPYDAGRIDGRFEGLISVMGAVTNHSSMPAHVTITAILRGHKDERLAETNAMDVMVHQLWPGETTPFRIDFAGADAADIIDLDKISAVDLLVRGVPTPYNLNRSLVLMDDTTLYNSGLQMVDIPRVLTTHTNRDGDLVWVSSAYLEQAIAPAEQHTFAVPPLPEGIDLLDWPINVTGPRLTDWEGNLPPVTLQGYSR